MAQRTPHLKWPSLAQTDAAFLLLTLLIVAAGLVALSSAQPSSDFLPRQAVYLGISFAGGALILSMGRRTLVAATPYLYGLSLFFLVLTHFFGTEAFGAQRWLKLGPLPAFQPSELAKFSLILVMAQVLRYTAIRHFWHYLLPGALVAVPAALVLISPDLGSALVFVAIGVGMIFTRGIPLRHIVLVALLLVATVPTVVLPNLKPHQKARIEAFMNPELDPHGSGYQVIQSRIAIGSGGLTGKGYGQGTQTQLNFIPFSHTDFIFPVIAEEGGFVAALGLLVLYGLLFWRLSLMAAECLRDGDSLIIIGVLLLIGFQVLVNVGVTLGLAPVTGLTLPLVSYGGTSLIATVASLALAVVVHRDRFQD